VTAKPIAGPPPASGGMLLWINGPSGGGKTATAYELNRRLPGSVVCNPEHIGVGMRRMLPAALWSNWWDLPALRHSVVELLRLTLAGWDGPVIVRSPEPSSSQEAGRSTTSASTSSSFAHPSSPSTSAPTS
jgi:hypothetical protein